MVWFVGIGWVQVVWSDKGAGPKWSGLVRGLRLSPWSYWYIESGLIQREDLIGLFCMDGSGPSLSGPGVSDAVQSD